MKKNEIVICLLSALIVISIFSFASHAVDRNATVTINVFTKKDFTIVIQPALKTVTPGTTATYAAMITNPNPVRVNADFTLKTPPGWKSEIVDSTVINPKSSKSITFKITSLNDSEMASYPIQLRAETTDEYAITGKAYASYNVDAHSEPDVSISPATQTSLPGKVLRYTITIKSNDDQGFDASSFVLNPILPKNWTSQFVKDNQQKSSLSFKLAAGEETNVFYDVSSPSPALTGAVIGVNVSTNKLSTAAYAFYDISLCGNGICNIAEDAANCPADCGIESRFSCTSDKCNEQVDDGVKFEASTNVQFSTFLVCNQAFSPSQCESAKNNCGLGKPCLCSTSLGASIGRCNVRCVDNNGNFYLLAKGISETVKSIYNYSFECPYVNLNEIKDMRERFSSALKSYEQAKSALTESINRQPVEKFNLQPCADAYDLTISQVKSFVSFLNGVISSPAISNTTEARNRVDGISSETESSIAKYCAAGATGLLEITSLAQPSTTEVRNTAQASVSARNGGGISYYGQIKCDFMSGRTKITVNSSCTRFEPGASTTFSPSVIVNTAGSWNVQCRTYGSLSSNCTPSNLHDTSDQNAFNVFSKDAFISDVKGSCSKAGVNCTVRMSNGKNCASCSIGNTACMFAGQSGNEIYFACPYTQGKFNITASSFSSNDCTPVQPVQKSAETRCPICGDGIVDTSLGEECELPGTQNNKYVTQESGLICKGGLSAIRDEFGFCTNQCRKSPDEINYRCDKGICGAECSDKETRNLTIKKGSGTCTYVQQCGSKCAFNEGDCETPDLSVVHTPFAPQTSDMIDIIATTHKQGEFSMNIIIDGQVVKTCMSPDCIYSSYFSRGEHTYSAALVAGDNSSSKDPATGSKKFSVNSAYSDDNISQIPKTEVITGNISFSVMHTPQNPVASQSVTILAITTAKTFESISIYIDGYLSQSCTQVPCSYTSSYPAGQHTYHAILTTNSRIIDAPMTGENTFTVTAPTCKIEIANASCLYNSTTKRYIVSSSASWNSALTDHAHMDIEGDLSPKIIEHLFALSREQSGPGLKTIKASVHDFNDSAICQDAKQVLCEGTGETVSSTLSVSRDVADTVGFGRTRMRLIIINDRNSNDFKLTENTPSGLNVSRFKVEGNSSQFTSSQDTTKISIQGSLKANQNITFSYDVDFQKEGSYVFSSSATSNNKTASESKTIYATACLQTRSVYASKGSECKSFTTSCEVPSGWNIVSSCPSNYKPAEEPVDLLAIIAIVIIVLIIVLAYFFREKIREKIDQMSEKKVMKNIFRENER